MKKYKLFLLLGLFILLTGCSYSFEVKSSKSIDKDEEASSIFLVVPDVSGMVEDDALEILEMNGFKVGKIILTKEYNYEDGLVIKTDPSSGSKIDEEDVVDIYISSSTSYEVEDYVGKSYLEVKPFLEDLGIIVSVEEKEATIYKDEFTIVSQEPKVGTVLESGDTIVLYIPKVEVLCPDFVKEEWNISEIEEFCSKYDLVLEKVFSSSSKKKGTILSQSIKPGSKIISHGTLTITIAS